MKLKKNIPLIDQHDEKWLFGVVNLEGVLFLKLLKKPVEDLTKEFQKLRKSKKFIKQRDFILKTM